MNTWTKDEERAFAEIQRTGEMDRLPAIRLFRRCNSDLKRALAVIADAQRLRNSQAA